MASNVKNNSIEEKKREEFSKLEDWKSKKIQRSYPGYTATQVDGFLDIIFNNYETILNEYFSLKESYRLLEEQNKQLFNENQEEKQKVVNLTKQLELEKMKKQSN